MKIEVWSDYVCPFCYIGKRKLEAALAEFPHKESVEIIFKSYQLDPHAETYHGQDYMEQLAKKFGSLEQVQQMTANVKKQAALVGLDFDFKHMKPTNTFTAHRLTKYAETIGKANALTEALLHAHFIDGKDVGHTDDLVTIAASVSIDETDAKEIIENVDAYQAEVEKDLQEAAQFQITGVPFFIFNRKYAISGAQPTETFAQALNQVWEEENQAAPFQTIGSDATATCDETGCDIPEK